MTSNDRLMHVSLFFVFLPVLSLPVTSSQLENEDVKVTIHFLYYNYNIM